MLNLVKIYLDTYLAVVLCSSKGVTDVIVVHLNKKEIIVVHLQQKRNYCGTS